MLLQEAQARTPIEEINDLNRRILAGEEPTAEEIHAVLLRFREQRRAAPEGDSNGKRSSSAKPKVDTSKLLESLIAFKK